MVDQTQVHSVDAQSHPISPKARVLSGPGVGEVPSAHFRSRALPLRSVDHGVTLALVSVLFRGRCPTYREGRSARDEWARGDNPKVAGPGLLRLSSRRISRAACRPTAGSPIGWRWPGAIPSLTVALRDRRCGRGRLLSAGTRHVRRQRRTWRVPALFNRAPRRREPTTPDRYQ